MSRYISNDEKNAFLRLKPEHITKSFFQKYFFKRFDMKTRKLIESKYKFTDRLKLRKGESINRTDIDTTLGRLIFNVFIVSEFSKYIDYINNPITKKELKKFESILSGLLLEDKITPQQVGDYLNKVQWLGFGSTAGACTAFSPKTIKPLPSVIKEKERLLKENKDRVDAGDPVIGTQIESKLVELAKKELKGDRGLAVLDCGAKPSFGNNYKNMYILRGPSYNPLEHKFENLTSSFLEGIEKKDIPNFATQVVTGSYPKAIGTGVAGYETKKFFIVYQDVVLDDKGSDCKSAKSLDFLITTNNTKHVIGRYIMEGTKPVKLDKSNINKYIGKRVKLRSPMFCTSLGDPKHKLCNICAGDLYYQLGIKNIGLTTSSVGNNLLNAGMKAFHDATVSMNEIDIDDMIL